MSPQLPIPLQTHLGIKGGEKPFASSLRTASARWKRTLTLRRLRDRTVAESHRGFGAPLSSQTSRLSPENGRKPTRLEAVS